MYIFKADQKCVC